MNSFFEKINLLILSMWKLTLGYYHGTSHSISIAIKVLAGLHQLPKKPGYTKW